MTLADEYLNGTRDVDEIVERDLSTFRSWDEVREAYADGRVELADFEKAAEQYAREDGEEYLGIGAPQTFSIPTGEGKPVKNKLLAVARHTQSRADTTVTLEDGSEIVVVATPKGAVGFQTWSRCTKCVNGMTEFSARYGRRCEACGGSSKVYTIAWCT